MKKIYEIKTIELSIIKTNPAALLILCTGTTRTTGWTHQQLFQKFYVNPPQNGMQEFNFFAEPPVGPVADKITDIDVSFILKPIPMWLKGVTIYSETNEMSQTIAQPKKHITGSNEIIGISNSFSFDEAIKDAVSKLPGTPGQADELFEFVLSETGIREGGFVGFHQLYVKLKKK